MSEARMRGSTRILVPRGDDLLLFDYLGCPHAQ
jgi:hypothetical protein